MTSAVIITTDKVYRNDEQGRPFVESDVLDGFEPYSNSESCAELAVASYKRSFPGLPPISAAAGGASGAGGEAFALFCILTVAAMWRYYADVEFRLRVNYRGFFLYYAVIGLGCLFGLWLFRLTLLPGAAGCEFAALGALRHTGVFENQGGII